MNEAIIGLGSNINPKQNYLQKAVHLLNHAQGVRVEKMSSVYETEPVGYTEQDAFLNMVVKVKTHLTPDELLTVCQQVEMKLGRKREIKWGPRTIDLDILLYNQENIVTEHLQIPHPRMWERAFVLIPLIELADDLVINGRRLSLYIKDLSEEERKGVSIWGQISGEEEFGHIES
nr:2-amino-4-hydroxy-6-hydroxymethyldihydropteridine diphosphokinase [Salirhabdus salicampi]